MIQNTKKKHIFILIFILGRIVFILKDAYISDKNEISPTTPSSQKDIIAWTIQESWFLEKQIAQKLKQNINIEDLQTLQKIYNKNKNTDILKQIIQKQAQNYQFNEALQNSEIIKAAGKWIDAKIYMYIYLNSSNIKINDKESINKILPIMEWFIANNELNNDDYLFYAGLIEIWNKNYPKALEKRQNIKNLNYQVIISNFRQAMNAYNPAKIIPQYYQDGLIALAALKNGYFNIARKLAVETVLQDEKYILPYQILAYSHFLTNNWETAIEYFLKLADFDKKNQWMYQFLIGVSYYRNKNYTSSILYLSQPTEEKYKTDILRYLLLNYIQIEDTSKMITTRQKLLEQTDLSPSDFFSYFYNVFYKAYFSQDISLYKWHEDFSASFLTKCIQLFDKDNDVCIYWKIGKESITEQEWSYENDLMQLADKYKQSYLYHMLGDFYIKKNDKIKAKENYLKALAISEDNQEKEIINQKLSTF